MTRRKVIPNGGGGIIDLQEVGWSSSRQRLPTSYLTSFTFGSKRTVSTLMEGVSIIQSFLELKVKPDEILPPEIMKKKKKKTVVSGRSRPHHHHAYIIAYYIILLFTPPGMRDDYTPPQHFDVRSHDSGGGCAILARASLRIRSTALSLWGLKRGGGGGGVKLENL